MKRERDNIKEQYDQLNEAYNSLCSESKYLQYGIEKTQHQMDLMALQTSKVDDGISK